MTTNGYLLERDAAALVDAGIDRVNVSIDSLARDRFHEITRRDALPQVLRGLEAIAAHSNGCGRSRSTRSRCATSPRTRSSVRGARPLDRLPGPVHRVHAARRRPRLGAATWCSPAPRSAQLIETRYPLEPLERQPHATARVYRFADGAGEIGFINPVSEPFCADCNRIRLTADGELRTCLFSIHETDLREPLRAGASDAELDATIRDAVWRKELKHHVNEPGFVGRRRGR